MEKLTEEQKEAFRQKVVLAQAVRQAMSEVIGEQRAEIIKRARAKLTALGIETKDGDFDAQLS